MILAALAIASATCSSDAPPTYACANAIDGRPETLWHTAWGPDAPPPHYIDLTLEWPSIVERVTVTPTGAVRITLSPAAEFTPTALLRIEQPAKIEAVGTYRPAQALADERGGFVVPLSKTPTTVELRIR